MEKWNWRIESINRKKLTTTDIQRMYEIERDTWSFFMWEYVQCTNCETVFSKEDIYGDIDENYIEKTVCKLEYEYGRENVKCKCCGWKTKDLRGEELISILESRIFWSKVWFVNFYRWCVDDILWFSYGFIDSPEWTYYREFKYHFSESLLDEFMRRFWNVDLLTLSGVCMSIQNNNIRNIYNLIKQFYCSINSKYNGIIWVWEVIVGSPAYKVYERIGARSLWLSNDTFLDKNDANPQTDVFFQTGIVDAYRKIVNMNLWQFISYTKSSVSWII